MKKKSFQNYLFISHNELFHYRLLLININIKDKEVFFIVTVLFMLVNLNERTNFLAKTIFSEFRASFVLAPS